MIESDGTLVESEGPTESDDTEIHASDSEATQRRKRTKNQRHKNRPTRLARYRAEFQGRRATMRANPKFASMRAKLQGNTRRTHFEAYLLRTMFCSGTRTGPGNECQIIGARGAYVLMNRFFNNFSLTRGPLLLQDVRHLGAPSNNGFIKILQFSKQGLDAYATLKCNQRSSADNLLYEYRVGMFINSIMHRFPCFVRTYGVYRLANPAAYAHLKDSSPSKNAANLIVPPVRPNPTPDELRAMLVDFPDYRVVRGCHNPRFIVLVTQFFKNCTPLHEFMHSNDPDAAEQIRTNLLQILYQVYYPLAELHATFTHYDLHASNILLYKVPDVNGQAGHIHFRYPNVEFRCQYLVKIIDYGRCFYSYARGSSLHDYETIHASPQICPNDGYDLGFGNLHQDTYWNGISADRKNETHDLRALDNVLMQIYELDAAGNRTGSNQILWDQLRGLSNWMHNRLFRLSRSLQYMNSASGTRNPSTQDIADNNQRPGWGAPERLHCTQRKPVCNVRAAEERLREDVRRFMERCANQDETTALGQGLFNSVPGEAVDATKYATIVVHGQHAVQFHLA